MAHLMGQLGLPSNPEIALPLLQRAATLATVDVPQPAYVYGLLLLAEFSHIQLPPHLFTPLVPPGATPQVEARKHLERAAYLNFAPAQYKLGHSYEYATPPFPFDALLSVQYYSLASQQGEVEADMALSKWFLCGAEGSFEKDESLAWTFADKAARKGLPSAEFAMGYYAEVGVGGPKDIEAARKWYTRVSTVAILCLRYLISSIVLIGLRTWQCGRDGSFVGIVAAYAAGVVSRRTQDIDRYHTRAQAYTSQTALRRSRCICRSCCSFSGTNESDYGDRSQELVDGPSTAWCRRWCVQRRLRSATDKLATRNG